MTGCGRYTVKSESPNENECKYCGGAGWRKKSTLPIEIFMWDRPQFQFWLNYSKIRFLFCVFFFLFVRGAGIFWRMSASENPVAPRSQRQPKDRGYCYLHFFTLHYSTSTWLLLEQLAEIQWAKITFYWLKIHIMLNLQENENKFKIIP